MKPLTVLIGLILSLSTTASTLEDREKLEKEIEKEEAQLRQENESFDEQDKKELLKQEQQRRRKLEQMGRKSEND